MSTEAFGYSQEIPESFRDMFMWLCQDLASLRNKWNFYLELFANKENTQLLSELALGFFNVVEESFRNDMTMAICRLSDPPQSFGHENLSLCALVQHCSGIHNLDAQLKRFLDACEPVSQYRNKRVGHNDLHTTIQPRDNPLPGIGRSQIDLILQIAGQILNSIYQNYVDGELHFEPVQFGGADDLIYWLKIAKDHQVTRARNLKARSD